jgi:3',5'-cyclic-AMP phosphodiesterase
MFVECQAGFGGYHRVAHLSDVHALESERDAYGWAHHFVSIHRRLDGASRLRKLERALLAAKQSGADHVVISGDLTETGSAAQFEAFAGVLASSKIPPEAITLVPGNHDAYTRPDGWRRALAGPLAPYAGSSASEPGRVVDRGGVLFLPVDTTRFQSVALSGGHLTEDVAEHLQTRLADRALSRRPVVLVMHHPPFSHARRLWQYIDGLRGAARLMELLARNPRVQVLHGHLHRALDRVLGLGRHRVFGAPATVDDREGRPRVRLFDVRDGRLESAGFVAT